MIHSHTFRYSDAADFVNQLEETKQKCLSSAEQEPLLVVRERYGLNAAQFSMRIKRFKGDLAVTREGKKGSKIVSLFVPRALDAYLRRPKFKKNKA